MGKGLASGLAIKEDRRVEIWLAKFGDGIHWNRKKETIEGT